MKPSWDDAPEWANWLAMDSDERWYWYEALPHKNGDVWAATRARFEFAGGDFAGGSYEF